MFPINLFHMAAGVAELFWALVIAIDEKQELDKFRQCLGAFLVVLGVVTFLVGFLSIVFTCIGHNL